MIVLSLTCAAVVATVVVGTLRVAAIDRMSPSEIAVHYWSTWDPIERVYLGGKFNVRDWEWGAAVGNFHAREAFRYQYPQYSEQWSDMSLVKVTFDSRITNEIGEFPGERYCEVLVGHPRGGGHYRVIEIGHMF